MMASLGFIQNDGSGLLLALLVLVAVSGSCLLRKEDRKSLGEWIRSNVRMVVTIEVLFFLAFALWTFVRASNPNIETAGGEKTMELAFINAILRSPTFPPHDPWLSGYAISYYYFGYVMTAMLAKLTGTAGSVSHNLMLSLIFALSAIGAYGILYNLLAAWHKRHPQSANRASSTGLSLLGPLFLLFVSNLEAFLEVLHGGGVFWKWDSNGTATSTFWSWLGIRDLSVSPTHLTWIPDRFIWWWRASRVITDLDLVKNSTEIIDEFPAFSFLLGDLHPHVLAMPFGLLAVSVALNLFLGGWKGETKLWRFKLSVQLEGLLLGSLVLGGLAFLNTWDILIGFALVAGAFILARALELGWTWERFEDIFVFCIPVGLASILLYLPFYVGFQSQAGGLLPNLPSPTRGVQLWVMFAPLFLAIMSFLAYLWRMGKRPARWQIGRAHV
jgi:YYY domain-containing protein